MPDANEKHAKRRRQGGCGTLRVILGREKVARSKSRFDARDVIAVAVRRSVVNVRTRASATSPPHACSDADHGAGDAGRTG